MWTPNLLTEDGWIEPTCGISEMNTPPPNTTVLCKEPWSYNYTLAMLYRYGLPIAIVTPDGHKSISPGLAEMLIGLLNRGERPDLTRIDELEEGKGK